MSAIKFLIFVAVAVACASAAEERVKKDVLLGASPYLAPAAYSGYAPAAYSGYAPAAYSGYAHAGYAGYAPSAYSTGYVAPSAYSGYYGHGFGAGLYRSGLYY